MPLVKGLAFRSVLRAVAELRGEGTLELVHEVLGEELSRSLRYVMASSWYPIEDYVALWRAIQTATGEQRDFPRLVGRQCVEQDLKLVHKMAFAALSVPSVIGISARLFGAYYDTGTCRSERTVDRNVRVEFSGCLGFSGAMWTELRGASESFAEQASKRPASSRVLAGGDDGDAETVFLVRWGAR